VASVESKIKGFHDSLPLREHRIGLERKRTWCFSTGHEFVAKAADIAGLYLTREEKALAIHVDEKPDIQTLKFRTVYAVSSDHKLIRGLARTSVTVMTR